MTDSRRDALPMWAVYDHPSDYPDRFVARLFLVGRRGTEATSSIIVAQTLEVLREILLVDMHLHRIERHPDDDEKIVETWL
jgi:hypothetical protein